MLVTHAGLTSSYTQPHANLGAIFDGKVSKQHTGLNCAPPSWGAPLHQMGMYHNCTSMRTRGAYHTRRGGTMPGAPLNQTFPPSRMQAQPGLLCWNCACLLQSHQAIPALSQIY